MPNSDSQPERFERLFRAFHPAVRAYARRRVPADSVDDIVSETFLVAWRRMDRVPEEPLPWLLTVAHNTIGTERRGEARRARLWIKAQSGYVEGHVPAEPRDDDGRGRFVLIRCVRGLFSPVVVPAGTQKVRFSCAALRIGVSRWSGAR
ncbi:MAG TPA: sigma-70 family RNA polymerase sigma factor [Solirubrobacteraceae bacterium]